MPSNPLLILNYDRFSSRLQQLYTQMNASPSLQELFVRDPATVTMHTLLPDVPQPTAAALSQSNRLVYSLLSNPGFMTWAQEYQKRYEEKIATFSPDLSPPERAKMFAATLDRDELYKELAGAVATFGDKEIFYSLLSSSKMTTTWDPQQLASVLHGSVPSVADVAVDVETFVYAVAAVAVFVAALIAVAVGAVQETTISRTDLQRVSETLVNRLQLQGEALRASGALMANHEALAGRIGP